DRPALLQQRRRTAIRAGQYHSSGTENMKMHMKSILRTILRHTLLLTAVLIGTSAHAQGPTATAIFAGGCFWCAEADFEKLPGVLGAESGYTGGKTVDPTYEQVSA